jgi:hypothetical protein
MERVKGSGKISSFDGMVMSIFLLESWLEIWLVGWLGLSGFREGG